MILVERFSHLSSFDQTSGGRHFVAMTPTLIRGREAQRIIAERVAVSPFTAYVGLRAWTVPRIQRSNLCLYSTDAIEEVVARFAAGEWPEREAVWQTRSEDTPASLPEKQPANPHVRIPGATTNTTI